MGIDVKHARSTQVEGGARILGVFKENESILRGFLRRFTSCRHDVEDFCQETILRALEAEKSRQIEEPKAFLFGVARNIVRKDLDKKSRSLIDFIEDYASCEDVSDESTVEDGFDTRQRMLLFGQAVATLPRQCQKVFLMKKVYGYTHKEIAKELDISVSTVEKHVASGLKRCSVFMARRLDERQAPGPSGRYDTTTLHGLSDA